MGRRSTPTRSVRRSRSSARARTARSRSRSPSAGCPGRPRARARSRSSATPSPSRRARPTARRSPRAVHGSTVLYPSDANQTTKLVAALADRTGISYIRTTREKTPIVYAQAVEFPIGGSKVVRGGSDKDRVAIIAAGITLHEAIKAHEVLEKQDIAVRVIDLYSVKPIDAGTLVDAAKATGGRVVVVEDHWPEGGIGDAVLAALAERGVREVRYRHLAVRKMPGSGKPAELLDAAGISTVHIVRAAKELVS